MVSTLASTRLEILLFLGAQEDDISFCCCIFARHRTRGEHVALVLVGK